MKPAVEHFLQAVTMVVLVAGHNTVGKDEDHKNTNLLMNVEAKEVMSRHLAATTVIVNTAIHIAGLHVKLSKGLIDVARAMGAVPARVQVEVTIEENVATNRWLKTGG